MRPGRFAKGFAFGAITVISAAFLIDWIDAVDLFVRPLLVADTQGPAEAIVVPGAGVIGPDCVPNMSALRRTIAAVRLYRAGKAPVLVFSGGRGHRTACRVGESMAAFAEQMGVPHDAILVENRAQSTHENAVFTREILAPRGVHRILIVTDALHVLRCDGAFRKAGFEVGSVSVPVVLVSSSNLSMLETAVHEYLGLVYYRLRGYS